MGLKIKNQPLTVYRSYDAVAESKRRIIEVATDGLGHDTRIRIANVSPMDGSFSVWLSEEEALALRDMLEAALPEMSASEAA